MRTYNIDFRKEDVTHITKRWDAAYSCSIIGVSSIGKSNLIQHLNNPEVQKHYLKNKQPTVTILVDPHLLGALPIDDSFRFWAGYELMMHRLYLKFYPFDMLEDAELFYQTYQMLQDGSNPLYAHMGLRYFELGLEFFFRLGYRIIFLLDEFEEFLTQMPASFFQSLRGLRDAHKDKLLFTTFSRQPLSVLTRNHPQLSRLEAFVELFRGNEWFLTPYEQRDANNMIQSLQKRHEHPIDIKMQNFLLEASGGFAGILSNSFLAMMEGKPFSLSDPEEALQKLLKRDAVKSECVTLWNGLTPEEQAILKYVISNNGRFISDENSQVALNLLVLKRLVSLNDGKIMIMPPVLKAFIQTYRMA